MQALGKGAADGHRFTDRFHLGAEHGRGAGELLEGEAGDLGDDVVDRGFEARGRGAGDVVVQLVEGVADGEQGGDLGDGVAGGFAREGRAAADAGVHLDDDDAAGLGTDAELHVAAAGVDADLADAGERGIAQMLVFAVGEGLGGGHGDRVAGVHAHRVEVFDGADDDDVVSAVAHDLELVFLPAEDGFVDEDLVHGRGFERVAGFFGQFVGGVSDRAARAAEGEAGAEDERVAVFDGEGFDVGEAAGDAAAGHVEADAGHRLAKGFAVFGFADGGDAGADEFDAVGGEHAGVGEGERGVERSLAAEGGQERAGFFEGDDRGDVGGGDGLDVDPIGGLGIGHDRGGVRVDEDHLEALGAQSLAGLGARVVELAGLADDDRSRADDEDATEVGAARHGAAS